jgi:hypothetical protein
MSDELNLNSIQRFRKQSVRLVLEQYSSCEVPAGCGGLVLRWRNPLALQWAVFWLYTPVKPTVLLDGQPLQRGRVDLAIGRHVVTLSLIGVDLTAALLLFAGVTESRHKTANDLGERPIRVLSADDGTWKYTLSPPPDDWTGAGFDDSSWAALIQRIAPTLTDDRQGAYACNSCLERGAICLGLPLPEDEEEHTSWWQRLLGRTTTAPGPILGNIWIRKVFDVVPPEREEPQP